MYSTIASNIVSCGLTNRFIAQSKVISFRGDRGFMALQFTGYTWGGAHNHFKHTSVALLLANLETGEI